MTTTTPHAQTGEPAHASPLPVQNANLVHALRSEWTKIRTVRSTVWTLGIMLLLVIGIGLLVASVVRGHSLDSASPLMFGFFGVLLGTIPMVTLGVLVISSEYGTGMIRTTLTACPSRVRVLAAKASVFFALALVLAVAACAAVAVIDNGMLGQSGGPVPTSGDWLRATVGVGLYVALLGLLSLAVGTMLRHSAGAITTMLGVVLLPLLLALFMQGDSLRAIRDALIEYSVPNALAALYGGAMNNGLTGWQPLYVLAGVTAVALTGAFVLVSKRDV